MFQLITDYSEPLNIVNAIRSSLPQDKQEDFDAKYYIDGFVSGKYIASVYTQKGEIVGYQVWLKYPDSVGMSAIVQKVFVLPQYVKQDLFNDFILFSINALKKHGFNKVRVECEPESPLSSFLKSTGIQHTSLIYEA